MRLPANPRRSVVRRWSATLPILGILCGIPLALVLLLGPHRVFPSYGTKGDTGPRSFSIDGERFRPARGKSDFLSALRSVSDAGEPTIAPENLVEELFREGTSPPEFLPEGRERVPLPTFPGLHPDHAIRIEREDGPVCLVFGRCPPGPSLAGRLETAGWTRRPESPRKFPFLERKNDQGISIGVVDESKGEYLFLLPVR